MKSSCEELEAKKKEVLLLESQVKDLEQKLQLADAKSKEKVSLLHCVILQAYSLVFVILKILVFLHETFMFGSLQFFCSNDDL